MPAFEQVTPAHALPQHWRRVIPAVCSERLRIPGAVVQFKPLLQLLTIVTPTAPLQQTRRGAKAIAARGPTEEEFKAFIRKCLKAWDDDARESVPPIFSWDNAKIHRSVRDDDWALQGISVQTHTLLPPYSPDMHSVIELSHARLVDAMQKFVNERVSGPEDNLLVYTEELKALFKSQITPEWAKATTHRLFIEVLPAVLEANGDYPPKHLR